MIKILVNILLLGFLAVGTYVIGKENTLYAGVYVFLLLISLALVSYSFCSKCASCQKTCAHPQIRIFRKIFPKRKISDYKLKDYLGLVPFIIIAIIIPQLWLWQNKMLLIIYWILYFLVLFGIVGFLCVKCENQLCKMNRNPKFKLK